MCCWFMRDYTAECSGVALRGPEPPASARGLLLPHRPVKEYWLFVIGSVTTECTQQQMRNRKKNALGVEMSCEQLGSTTEHLRGVIDSLQCF